MAERVPKRSHSPQSGEDRSASGSEPSAKRVRSYTAELERWATWRYPPEFWKRLPTIYLTREALHELNRLNRLERNRTEEAPEPVKTTQTLAQYARHGGPDLTYLRGFPPEFPFTMVEEEWPESQATGSAPADAPESAPIVESVPATVVEPATEPTPLTELEPAESEPAESEEETEDASSTRTFETQRSTPYTRHFDTHLASFGIRPSNSSQEPDLEAVREALAPDRASLLPSQFSIGSFKMFRETNDWAQCDADVVANVLPHILGFDVIAHENSAQNLVFSNLAPLTDGTIAHAKPDVYYGADPDEVHDTVCDALGRYIDPSAVFDAPLAPNFFVEVKAPLGSWGVVKRQARYDGAIGCRAMHSLQNFGANNSRPRFDSRPTAFSAIYRNGGLHLFAHHVTAPDDSDRNGSTAAGRPQYHMTPLLAYALTDSPETFTDGVEAFRNLRDYAKQLRDQAIQAANFAAARDGPAFKDETEDKTGRTIEYEFEGELEEQTNETRKLMEEGSGDQPALSTSETNTALDNLLT